MAHVEQKLRSAPKNLKCFLVVLKSVLAKMRAKEEDEFDDWSKLEPFPARTPIPSLLCLDPEEWRDRIRNQMGFWEREIDFDKIFIKVKNENGKYMEHENYGLRKCIYADNANEFSQLDVSLDTLNDPAADTAEFTFTLLWDAVPIREFEGVPTEMADVFPVFKHIPNTQEADETRPEFTMDYIQPELPPPKPEVGQDQSQTTVLENRSQPKVPETAASDGAQPAENPEPAQDLPSAEHSAPPGPDPVHSPLSPEEQYDKDVAAHFNKYGVEVSQVLLDRYRPMATLREMPPKWKQLMEEPW